MSANGQQKFTMWATKKKNTWATKKKKELVAQRVNWQES